MGWILIIGLDIKSSFLTQSMQFTEISFAIFFFAIFVIYWLLLRQQTKMQNLLLLAASYLFYGWWDWRFLGLIIFTTISTYLSGIFARNLRYGRMATAGNVVFNIGILFTFKYFNFFSLNLYRLFALAGWSLDWFTIDVLLPVGMSFYTFQAIAYSVDVYKQRVEPSRDPIVFATFIAYFPQLVAGPIERASQLLPQLQRRRRWRSQKVVEGARMLLFGVMKKVCVADMLGLYVDRIFDSGNTTSVMALAGGVLFALQIYCDFSAYSEIARGVSRMLGIELMANFRFPYFSRNIVEFWHRWHISLMLWFRDYVYIPLGGNRRGSGRTIANWLIVFLLSGLWHGASWNFVVWGFYWAVVYIVGRKVFGCKRQDGSTAAADLPSVVATLGVVMFSMGLFRSHDLDWGLAMVRSVWLWIILFGLGVGGAWLLVRYKLLRYMVLLLAVVALCAVAAKMSTQWYLLLKAWWLLPAAIVLSLEWHNRTEDCPTARLSDSRLLRLSFYWVCMALILLSEPVDMTFIYFQF